MEKTKAIPLLGAEDIDVKVKQVTQDSAYLLLYKNARVDMKMLDEVFGEENWESDYKVVNDNLYAGIGIYFADTQRTVWKWDCGIESRSDGGNEKKGEASDAFKRAAFKWGIGRELYSAPKIKIKVETEPQGKGFKIKGFKSFDVKAISYDEYRKIKTLVIVDEKGSEVYTYPWKSAGNASRPAAQAKQVPFDTEKESNVDKVKKALKGSGWSLEIAERSSMKNYARSIDQLNDVQLKAFIKSIEEAKSNGNG